MDQEYTTVRSLGLCVFHVSCMFLLHGQTLTHYICIFGSWSWVISSPGNKFKKILHSIRMSTARCGGSGGRGGVRCHFLSGTRWVCCLLGVCASSPPREQKNRCKNITFLQLCWQAVKCVSETIVRSKETYWFCRSFTVELSLQILSNLTLSKRDMNNKIMKCFGEIEALSTTYR